uniref:ubiquitin domain-containing protein 1-like n=1 Tax=Styela clava TaxID=7725 RepID=UPI001939703F|nr:ubiquitin domain-containing protein 1-like [Styela clava]
MGACLGSHRNRRHPRYGDPNYPAIGKNQPLKKEHPRWRSEVPLTEGQLRSKRDEFWDTAPAFEGRKEIWDALKAAAVALEAKDYGLAQAIIDGANISLPHGTLLDCYDELGSHYQLPVYCLAPPVNLLVGSSANQQNLSEEFQDISSTDKATTLKIRLSTGVDIKLRVLPQDTVFTGKRRLEKQEGVKVSSQRWIFAGKMLPDQQRIEQLKIETTYIVQCIITELPGTSS